MGAATQWLFNFVITEITPAAVNHIGYRTFIMFGCFCFGMGVFVFLFIKETKGRTLESMDVLFGTIDADKRAVDVELMLQEEKGIIAHQEYSAPQTASTEVEVQGHNGQQKPVS